MNSIMRLWIEINSRKNKKKKNYYMYTRYILPNEVSNIPGRYTWHCTLQSVVSNIRHMLPHGTQLSHLLERDTWSNWHWTFQFTYGMPLHGVYFTWMKLLTWHPHAWCPGSRSQVRSSCQLQQQPFLSYRVLNNWWAYELFGQVIRNTM